MKIWINDLWPGDKVIHDVFNDHGLHVISSGTIIGKKEIGILKQFNIDMVEIAVREEKPENLNFATRHFTQKQIAENIQPQFNTAVQGIKDLFDQAMAENIIDNEHVRLQFEPLVQCVEKERDVVSLLHQLNTQDDYTYQHSVQVGLISYYIAKWLLLTEAEALLVGKAGYLHDIGKSRINKDILQKPTKLTVDEFAEIKKHTIYGHDILNNSVSDSILSRVAIEHHERMNGTGYPFGLRRDQLHQYSKIISVADIYSAMISTRAYQKKRNLFIVLKELHRLSFEEIDPMITQTFIQNMLPHFLGKKLILSNGLSGEVVFINYNDYFNPLVKLDSGEFIDLSKHRSLEIENVTIV